MTIFDNGNTRVSQPGTSTGGVPGLGAACKPNDCDSRGMAITFDETAMTVSVSPDGVSLDLGSFSTAMGSAELLGNGNYFFENPIVLVNLNTTDGYSMELAPTPAAPQVGKANVILNVAGPEHYRGWQMPSLYFPQRLSRRWERPRTAGVPHGRRMRAAGVRRWDCNSHLRLDLCRWQKYQRPYGKLDSGGAVVV